MNWRLSLVVCGLVLAVAPVRAQLALPGAAPAAPAGGAAVSPKPKKPGQGAKAAKAAKAKPVSAPDAAAIDGTPLMLNGREGLLQLSGSGDTLQIDKLRLPGESVSDPSQRCIVDIVGEKPIEATSEGRPDGLERYDVDVPACPFTFDVVDGAVLVPSQITACVFKAADCQTSPGGLWGPDGAGLEKDAAAIGKRRNEAEKAMARGPARDRGAGQGQSRRGGAAARPERLSRPAGRRLPGLCQGERARLLRREPHRGAGGAPGGPARSPRLPRRQGERGRQAGKEREEKEKAEGGRRRSVAGPFRACRGVRRARRVALFCLRARLASRPQIASIRLDTTPSRRSDMG